MTELNLALVIDQSVVEWNSFECIGMGKNSRLRLGSRLRTVDGCIFDMGRHCWLDEQLAKKGS